MPLPFELISIVVRYLRIDVLIRAAHAAHHVAAKKAIEARVINVVMNENLEGFNNQSIMVKEFHPTWSEYHGAIALGNNKLIQRLTEKEFFYPPISGLRSVIDVWQDMIYHNILYLNDNDELRLANYNRGAYFSDELLHREVRWARHRIVNYEEIPRDGYFTYKESSTFICTSEGTIWYSYNLSKKWREIKCIPNNITDIWYFDQHGDEYLAILSDEKLYIDEILSDTDVLAFMPYEKHFFYLKRNGQVVRWDKYGTITYDRNFLVVPYFNTHLTLRLDFDDGGQGSLDIQGYHPSELIKYLKYQDHVSLKFVNGISNGPEYTWDE